MKTDLQINQYFYSFMLKYLMVIPTRKKIRTFDHERCIVGYLIEVFFNTHVNHNLKTLPIDCTAVVLHNI